MHNNEQLTPKEKEMNCSVDDSIIKGIKEFKLEQEGKNSTQYIRQSHN